MISINIEVLPQHTKDWIKSVQSKNKTLRCLRDRRSKAKTSKEWDLYLQLGLALRFLSDLEIIKNNTQQ